MEIGKNTATTVTDDVGLVRGAGGEATGFTDRYAAARPLQYSIERRDLNHRVFRYPAKFHPPIAAALVDLASEIGQTVRDPFCGSGTLLIEAVTRGRNAVGSDVDPLAVFISRAKTSLTDLDELGEAAARCKIWLSRCREADLAEFGEFFHDITAEAFENRATGLRRWIPELPRMSHWFRRRAVVQLATIRRYILQNHSGQGQLFLNLCFGSIIRHSSNADPVPISGLEVTSHMLAKEAAGRAVDPWTLLRKSIDKTLAAATAFVEARDQASSCLAYQGDARVQNDDLGKADAIITSPPYLTAVDYYRRHTLEMYWLGLTNNQEERLELMRRYIGRDRVALSHFGWDKAHARQVADNWMPRFGEIDSARERAFRHYCDGMARSLACMQRSVKSGGPVVIVAGDVRFSGTPVSMLELMNDLAPDTMHVADHLWYPIKNRYMSYARKNEASIAADHVLVFRSNA